MISDIYILPALSESKLAYMDALLLNRDGRFLAGAHWLDVSFDPDKLRAWCHLRARYGLVTAELLDWLREIIGTRSALEIGAGMGDLGYRLKIPMTDSYQQATNPTTVQAMAITGQPPTRPPADVLKMDAQTAVLKFKPQVVIGSWITQRFMPADSEGNMHGPREEEILKNCETYIHIGNDLIHSRKRICALPHERYKFPWLKSRSRDQSSNCIYLWNKK